MIKRRMQKLSFLQKYKKYIYACSGALALGVLSFVVTISIAGNKANNKIVKDDMQNINEFAYKKDESSIRINPDSIKSAEADIEEKIEITMQKTAVKTDENEAEKVNNIEEKKTIEVNNSKGEEKTIEVNVVPIKKEVSFIHPIEGEIILEFAKDKLVYSNTLEEWITHNGVDIKGDEAMPVKASADGKIKDKKFDPRYGNTIIIEHDDGYKSVYSNLSTLDLVEIGQDVKQGDIISGVGQGYGFEVDEGPHVHYEVWRDTEPINPVF